MSFVRARSKEQKEIRIKQIIDATLEIYKDTPYEKITLATIAKRLDFTRANLYKYVKSKEEIFLKIIEYDLKQWINDLQTSFDNKSELSIEEFAEIWSQSLFDNTRLLQLFSVLYIFIEKNVSVDDLATFKTNFFTDYDKIFKIVKQFNSNLSNEQVMEFLHLQFFFAIGLYPASIEHEVQVQAIKKAKIPYKTPDFITTFSNFIIYTIKGMNGG